jgi:NAD(P)-dependent dehydrogenase (short-subunit alcohol dehydrogenase family)
VNAISPATSADSTKFGLPPAIAEQVARNRCARIPLGRFGNADEIAGLALLLASDSAS